MDRNFLRSILINESRAYGFTIAFWGSGIVLVNSFGLPALENVLLYGAGAVTGFALLSIYAFRRAFTTAESEGEQFLVMSMIHYIASLVPILVTASLTSLDGYAALFLSGLNVALVYNLLMLVEEILFEELKYVEQKLVKL